MQLQFFAMFRGLKTQSKCLLLPSCVLLLSCTEANTPYTNVELAEMPSFAVLVSDYASSSVSLLDAEGELIAQDWFHSGSEVAGLVAALSGDVVFASRQQPGHLTLLDRFKTDVITQFALPNGILMGQLRTQDAQPADSHNFSSNPHDVCVSSQDTAWVSRHGVNVSSTAPPVNRGNDLLRFDPRTMQTTAEYISFDALNVEVQLNTDHGPRTELVYARPSNMVCTGTTAVVGLARLSRSFQVAGPGVLALVNLVEKTVRNLSLDGLMNCGRVVSVPNQPHEVIVACEGFARPYRDETQTRNTAGLLHVRVEQGVGTILKQWRPLHDEPLAVSQVIAIDVNHVLAVATGLYADDGTQVRPDVLYEVNIAEQSWKNIYAADESFVLGSGVWVPEKNRLFLPDASAGVVQLKRDDAGVWQLLPAAVLPGEGRFGPRQVARLLPQIADGDTNH